MPIVPRIDWCEDDGFVFLSLFIPGASRSNTDIQCTAWFLKVNNAPKYLYQVDLLHKVDEMQTEVQMFPDHILIILCKINKGEKWGTLYASEEPEVLASRREVSIKESKERVAQLAEQKKTKEWEESRLAVKQQVEKEQSEREQRELQKAKELKAAQDDLEEWKKRQISQPISVATADPNIPPARSPIKLSVSFTPLPSSCPMRTPQEEEEVAQKPERIPPVATADSLGSFELNEAWLKDKGDKLFRSGDFQGAVNAYTAALKIIPSSFQLLSNRSAALLKLQQFQLCIDDSSVAISLLHAIPQTPNRDCSLGRVLARRASAKLKMNDPASALHDLEEASQLVPDDVQLLNDIKQIRSLL